MKEKCKNMTEGRQVYNIESGRYGFWVSDLWWHNGFQWTTTRMEININQVWCFVGTPYRVSNLECVRARIK